MPDYPKGTAPPDGVEPVPRRIRAFLAGQLVLDTHAGAGTRLLVRACR